MPLLSSDRKSDHITVAGSQRFRCKLCQRRYTPAPKERGYTDTNIRDMTLTS